MSFQPQVHGRQLLFQLPVHQMAAVGQEDGEIVFSPVFLQYFPHCRDGVDGVDVAHFKKQIVFVRHHSGAVIGGQTNDQEPLAQPLQEQMAFQAWDWGSIVMPGVGTDQGQVHQPFQVLAAQVNLVVAQSHGIQPAELHQPQGRFAPV